MFTGKISCFPADLNSHRSCGGALFGASGTAALPCRVRRYAGRRLCAASIDMTPDPAALSPPVRRRPGIRDTGHAMHRRCALRLRGGRCPARGPAKSGSTSRVRAKRPFRNLRRPDRVFRSCTTGRRRGAGNHAGGALKQHRIDWTWSGFWIKYGNRWLMR